MNHVASRILMLSGVFDRSSANAAGVIRSEARRTLELVDMVRRRLQVTEEREGDSLHVILESMSVRTSRAKQKCACSYLQLFGTASRSLLNARARYHRRSRIIFVTTTSRHHQLRSEGYIVRQSNST